MQDFHKKRLLIANANIRRILHKILISLLTLSKQVQVNRYLFRLFRDNEIKVHELNYLFWECTTRCNLHCRHCGSDCSVLSREKDMPVQDFLKALDSIPVSARPKDFTVVLTGGEPLLRPDIIQAGAQIRDRGFAWGMVSNGWFYDEQKHAALMEAGMRTLTISLDGLEASHDWMRSVKGSYSRVLRAIGIAAADPRLNFDVVSCVNKRNLKELPEMYSILSSLGVRQWRLFTIIPIGRAASDPDMHLSDSEFVSLMDFICAKREAKGKMNVTFSCEGYLGRYEEKVRDQRYFCHAGINIASVLIDGRICACPQHRPRPFQPGQHLRRRFLRCVAAPLPGVPQAGLGKERHVQGLPSVERLPGQRHAQLAWSGGARTAAMPLPQDT